MRFACLLPSFVLLLSSLCVASQINRITLPELEARADYVVLAQVTEVVQNGNEDQVTIRAASFLKGKSEEKSFTFTLVTRGGIKDFDPAVKAGDSGVFFLKKLDETHVHKAYWGSVAVFPKNHFDLAK